MINDHVLFIDSNYNRRYRMKIHDRVVFLVFFFVCFYFPDDVLRQFVHLYNTE